MDNMDPKEIKEKIHDLAGDIPAEQCQEGVQELDKEIMGFDSKLPIQKFPSGNYWYFKTIEYSYPGRGAKRNIIKETLGKISKENYEKNKMEIDELMKNRNKEELIKYLEQY